MGSVKKAIKVVKKAVKKPISKAFKGIAKGIMKVGKATMRGVAKLSAKLGPIGSIALSMAMPWALGALGTGTTALMNSSNVFLKSIGTVGNSIRNGYKAFNAFKSKTFSTITQSISKGFQKFAPQGVKNIFSNISTGAKNLYTKARETMTAAKGKLKNMMPKPFTAKSGTIEFYGAVDPGVGVMSSPEAMSALQNQTLLPSQLGEQKLSKGSGWFTKANTVGTQADEFVTQTINDAYKERLKGFNTNARRLFDDTLANAKAKGTYINYEEIGSEIEKNAATKRTLMETLGEDGVGKFNIKTDIEDLIKTGDYVDNGQGGFRYTGNKTFANFNEPSSFKSKAYGAAKKLGGAFTKSLLGKQEQDILELPSVQGEFVTSNKGAYTGTDIQGSGGGSLLEGVFSEADRNKIMNYYQNMNLIGSS